MPSLIMHPSSFHFLMYWGGQVNSRKLYTAHALPWSDQNLTTTDHFSAINAENVANEAWKHWVSLIFYVRVGTIKMRHFCVVLEIERRQSDKSERNLGSVRQERKSVRASSAVFFPHVTGNKCVGRWILIMSVSSLSSLFLPFALSSGISSCDTSPFC